MSRIRHGLAAAVVAALTVAHAPAQQLLRVTPEAAEPGDLVILFGTNLGGTTTVRFTAAAGFTVVQVVPVQVTATAVTATVPVMVTFAQPPTPVGPVPVSSPLGTVEAGTSVVQFSNPKQFFVDRETARIDKISLRSPGIVEVRIPGP